MSRVNILAMAGSVKRRRYDATGRRAQSAETRTRVLEAARRLFVAGGYRATTVAAIAAAAGVNPDTVYSLVGSKPALLGELIERAVSHADRAVPAEDRDYVLAVRAEPAPRRKVVLYATALVETQRQLAPWYKVIREAAPSESEVGALWRKISDRRLQNMQLFVTDLEAAEPLRAGVTVDDAAHHVWTLNSPDVFLLLTEDRGWSPEQVRDWLAQTWERLLFE
jgi:AcrR family transcriptional regulator